MRLRDTCWNIASSALNKDFFIFLAWKSIEKYFSTSQKCIQNNFSDQKSIEKYFSISQKFIQNNFSYQKSIEKYFFNSLKFISMIFSDHKIIRIGKDWKKIKPGKILKSIQIFFSDFVKSIEINFSTDGKA